MWQKKAIHFIAGGTYNAHTNPLFKQPGAPNRGGGLGGRNPP